MQEEVLKNIRHRIRCKLGEHSNLLDCFDFMNNNYIDSLTEEDRKKLGHNLRFHLSSAVEKNWMKFWKKKTKSQTNLLTRVYDNKKVEGMLNNPTVWADVYTIFFAMHVLDINIMFFDNNRQSIYCGVQGENMTKQPTIFVLWVDNSHFQPIVRLTCDKKGVPRIKGVFRFNDDRIVNHIYKVWRDTNHCPAVKLEQVML